MLCVGHKLGIWLKSRGYDVLFVRDRDARMEDEQILSWGYSENRILITNDKDFGYWIFQQGKPHAGLIRLPNVNWKKRIELVKMVLKKYSKDLKQRAIITITEKRVRVTYL